MTQPLYYDYHERKTKAFDIDIPKLLIEYKIPLERKRLPVGDYVVIGPTLSVCIESKTAGDYLSSIENNILNNELLQISANYDYGVLAVHGNINDEMVNRKMRRNTWIEFIAGCVVNIAPTGKQGRISVVTVESVFDMVAMLRTLYKKITSDNYIREPTAQKVDIPEDLEQVYTLRWLFPPSCHIGPKRSRQLLGAFGSIRGVVNATTEEMEVLKGFGPKMTSEIETHLKRRYKDERTTK